MHVRVQILFDLQQRAARTHVLDDLRIGFPDRQSTPLGQRGRIAAVTHDRAEDFSVANAITLA